MTHIVSVQDRIDEGNVAMAAQKNYAAAIAAVDTEIARYAKMNDEGAGVTGGYVAMAVSGLFLHRRGSPLKTLLAPSRDGLRSAMSFITQSEVARAVQAWNAGLDSVSESVGYTVMGLYRIDALRLLRANLVKEKTVVDDIVRQSDPYFDGSGAAQDFEANEGRFQ